MRGSLTPSRGLKRHYGMLLTGLGSPPLPRPSSILPSQSQPTANCGSWGERVPQLVDPHHLASNKIPPPVHIERIIADHKSTGKTCRQAVSHLRLPARVRISRSTWCAEPRRAGKDSLQVQARRAGQRLERGRQRSRSAVLEPAPGPYRFRVVAANNSGVWNEQGDSLEFSIDPAYYQTSWFRALCVAAFMALLWAAYQLRVRVCIVNSI